MAKRTTKKIINTLITSPVRCDIMTLFYTNPDKEFHMREIAREVNQQINAVRRETINLVSNGFLTRRPDGIKMMFKLDTSFIFFEEFKSIFSNQRWLDETKTTKEKLEIKHNYTQKA